VTSRVLQRQVGVKHHTWPFQHWALASAPGHPVLRFMIDYITQNRHRVFSREGADMDALLRSGAAPFNDAVTAFRKSPVPGHDLRIAPIGTFALGQVWGKGDVITKPCATARHGFGWWYDANRKRHSKSTLD